MLDMQKTISELIDGMVKAAEELTAKNARIEELEARVETLEDIEYTLREDNQEWQLRVNTLCDRVALLQSQLDGLDPVD